MAKATEIKLMEEEQKILKSWVSKGTTEHRLVERARIVLEAAEGKTTISYYLIYRLPHICFCFLNSIF